VAPATPITCGTIETFADGLVPSAELHVSPDGDDDSGDGSPQFPFATIGRATRSADPGMAIRVHEGTYPGGEFVEDLTGTPTEPIWVGGVPGEARPVIVGSGEEGLLIAGASFAVIHDLEVRYLTDNGIIIDDRGEYNNPLAAHHVVVRNVLVENIGGDGDQDCLRLEGVRQFTVVDSTFRNCGGDGLGSGIDVVGGHDGLIARNLLEDLYGSGVQVRGGSVDVEIRWNRIRDAGERAINMGGATDFGSFRPPLAAGVPNAEARDIRAVANLIERSDAPLAFTGCIDCLATHNTIVDPKLWLLRIVQETNSSGPYLFEEARNGRVENNLVHFARADLVDDVGIGPKTEPATFTFAHNLWFAHDAPNDSAPALPVSETAPVIGEDPEFLPGGYAIGATSPAAGAGQASPDADGDIAGRCFREPPSIGAYEVADPGAMETGVPAAMFGDRPNAARRSSYGWVRVWESLVGFIGRVDR